MSFCNTTLPWEQDSMHEQDRFLLLRRVFGLHRGSKSAALNFLFCDWYMISYILICWFSVTFFRHDCEDSLTAEEVNKISGVCCCLVQQLKYSLNKNLAFKFHISCRGFTVYWLDSSLIFCLPHVYHVALSICALKSFFDGGSSWIRIQIKNRIICVFLFHRAAQSTAGRVKSSRPAVLL